MATHPTPELSAELGKRIRLVRRDLSNLLFHFTRNILPRNIEIKFDERHTMGMSGSAYGVLRKILYDRQLIGSSHWTYGYNAICFSEGPIQELHSVFSLVSIAASKEQRPRYEPWGVAVNKNWFFQQGGRPVIYDHPDAFEQHAEPQRYRFVPYDPSAGVDFTWEREWRGRWRCR